MAKVLVVDDVAANRELLVRRLKRLGHSIEQAENGQVALDMLTKDSFDLVLLDIMMPVLSGFELLAIMKKDPKLSFIPVIILSSLDKEEAMVKGIELGAEDFLSKPFTPTLLKARVSACLAKKELHDKEQLYLEKIEAEKRRFEELLHVILPAPIATELQETGKVIPRTYENACVLFCDLVDFTTYCSDRTPEEVVQALQEVVILFEDLNERHKIQKIKTIGDAFMSVAGVITPTETPVADCVNCALEMVKRAPEVGPKLDVRIGIQKGAVMAAVIGQKQYLFDVWGDTVNAAAHIAQQGGIANVTIAKEGLDELHERYPSVSLGKYPIKSKGNIELFRIN